MIYFGHFYLDREKDMMITLYKELDRIFYVLRTPNHSSGNLIRNLAKVADLPLSTDENGLFIIRDEVPCFITTDNREVYQLRFQTIKIADIYADGRIEVKAAVPAVMKTLMSQTKEYSFPLEKTVVNTYIPREAKFRTDLHAHMNANLTPDLLIALGIFHQIRYPLYYVKKLGLKLTADQWEKLYAEREKAEEIYKDSPLEGKLLDRKIDDHTFINFASLILGNLTDGHDNIVKIRASLSILKDGQAVFTNLEKVYLYRYVFTKGVPSEERIDLNYDAVPSEDISRYLQQIMLDSEDPRFHGFSLFQNKLLWIARSYKRMGIVYAEITDTTLTKPGAAVEMLKQVHEAMPEIFNETGVMIRFLAGIRRIPLNIVKDNVTPEDYLRENLAVIRAIAPDPYIAGSDIIGEEINDISNLRHTIAALTEIAGENDGFVIRIHAGENDSLKNNVSKAIELVRESLQEGQFMPYMRIGHGLYTENLNSAKGRELMKMIRESGVVLEFQITSNIRLNNLNDVKNHPLKKYLDDGISCVQGSDGFGMYGTDSMEEQLALDTLLNLSYADVMKMRQTEDRLITVSREVYSRKKRDIYEYSAEDTDIYTYYRKRIEKYLAESAVRENVRSEAAYAQVCLGDRYRDFPQGKVPIIMAGGSFNTEGRITRMTDHEINLIDRMAETLDPEKCYFVIGHKLNSYEGYLYEKCRDRFMVFAIVPSILTDYERRKLQETELYIHISPEMTGMGIYKSFNYEIFERGSSIVLALDGNSAGMNLLQEAKNGKGKAKIFVAGNSAPLREKAESLVGYMTVFNREDDILETVRDTVEEWYPLPDII